MADTTLSIGALAARTAVKVPTIRFYEQTGLLPLPDRSANGRRVYGEDAVRRLGLIRMSRQLGFSTDAIRILVELSDNPDTDCGRANRLAAEQLVVVEDRIGRLEALRDELRRLAATGCRGRAADCRVIEGLSDAMPLA
jgi:DNA-binding transcriptional MerR regulator